MGSPGRNLCTKGQQWLPLELDGEGEVMLRNRETGHLIVGEGPGPGVALA